MSEYVATTLSQNHISEDYMQDPIQCAVQDKKFNKIHFLMSKQLKTNGQMLSSYHNVQKKVTNRLPATESTSSKNIILFPASRALRNISRR
jgi:flagellar motor component MotA